MPTKLQFATAFSTLFASSAWAVATPEQRLTHVEDTLKALPVLWDVIKNLGETVLTGLYENLRRYGEPDPPTDPAIEDFFDLWWFYNVGAALMWSTGSPGGSGGAPGGGA